MYDDGGQEIEYVGILGTWFLMVFLLINIVMLLNFIIAILGNTYGVFQPQMNGLYLYALIRQFQKLEWDEEYGCLACSQFPFSGLSLILWPLYLCVNPKLANTIIAHCLYFPYAIIFASLFTLGNALCAPFAYLYALLNLSFGIFQ